MSIICWISVGLKAAGTVMTPASRARSKISGVNMIGESMNSAPASIAWRASSAFLTVPAPTWTSEPNSLRACAMDSIACGELLATSMELTLVPTSCSTTLMTCLVS